MAGAVKHGAHRYSLSIPLLAAGAAATDAQASLIYDAYAEGGTTVTGYTYPYDLTSEQVIAAYYTVGAAVTGQATNFFAVQFALIRAAVVLNSLQVVYNAAGVTTAVNTIANLNVASGAVVPNTGTGTLAMVGSVLPWTLQQGDILQLARVSTGTGLASPSISLTFWTKQFGT